MASTTFTDNITPIISAWLQDVNSVTYTLFGNGSSYSGVLTLAGTTDATSITTGMSKNAGGASIQKALWVGGLANIAGAVTLQSQLAVTGVATLTAQPILSSLTASLPVFSDASKGLVSNAMTGTGNVVMSNNAILVTPDIGTPSAGVATNLTGTAAGLTAGTASAVAVGGITGLGTGVATALAVNVGSAGAFVTFNGAGGTPSSMTATNLTGTATSLNIGGNAATATTASAVAVGGITGLGTGVATALAVNVGSAGAPVVNGGALGTPSGGVATNLTGTASGLSIGGNAATATLAATVTTNANLTGDVTSAGNATTVVKINGTSLAVLGTGILKNTTTTGVPSIAVAGDFPTLNQNTSGSSASCTGNAATASAVAVGGITGLGTGVATALAVNVGSAGAPVLFNGAGGTPSSMTATNLTGTATSLNIGGNAATATTAVTVSTTVASGATGTTQTPSDASTKMATTAYVDAAVPPGTVHAYAGTAAPTGYLLCDGGSYLIATYPNLSAVIRATFGGVDGTHFYTPDLRGRGVFGKDDMGGAAASRITAGVSGITGTTLGAAGGSQSLQGHTHTGTTGGQSADHTHTVPLATQTIMSPAVISEVTRSGGSTTSSATSNDHTHSFTSDSTGAGSSQNVPPAIMLNYIIKY